jgi:isopenicillin N synthase-like dioxygenase
MSELQTFALPSTVEGGDADKELGKELVAAWRRDGIFQIHATSEQQAATERALNASRDFFRRPLAEKVRHVSDLTYSRYVASGEEETAGEKDGSEIFTVCPDIAVDDARVAANWPCHGPAPWPSARYEGAMKDYMAAVGDIGHRLLQLTALGLGLDDMGHFTRLTDDGWHHMRVLRFPPPGRRDLGTRHRLPHRLRTAGDRRTGRRGRPVHPATRARRETRTQLAAG